jgi:hypothetical protein
MAGGGGWLGHVSKIKQGFYSLGSVSRRLLSCFVVYRSEGMVAKAVGDVRRTGGQWRMAVRPPPSVRRPRVTGLSLHVHVTGPSCTVAAVRVSDRWSLRRLGVRARPGYSEPTWRARGDVVRGCPELHKQFRLTMFVPIFLPFSK